MPSGPDGHPVAQGLGGLLVDLVSPLRPDGTVDGEGLESLLLHVSADRFDGVVVAGTAGEGPLLPLAVRTEITALAAGHTPRFRQVLPLAVGTSPDAVVVELDSLASAGATAALVSPLSYYGMDTGAVAGFLARVVARAPLPLVLCHSPRLTGVAIPAQLVGELAGEGAVIGIHDAGGDSGYLSWLVLHAQDCPGFGVLGGDDAGMMAAILVGAAGVVAASANVVPGLVAELYGHSRTRSLHSARSAQRRLLSVVSACGRYGLPGGWKSAASAAGLCGPTPALPGYGLSPDDARRLRDELVELGAIRPGP